MMLVLAENYLVTTYPLRPFLPGRSLVPVFAHDVHAPYNILVYRPIADRKRRFGQAPLAIPLYPSFGRISLMGFRCHFQAQIRHSGSFYKGKQEIGKPKTVFAVFTLN